MITFKFIQIEFFSQEEEKLCIMKNKLNFYYQSLHNIFKIYDIVGGYLMQIPWLYIANLLHWKSLHGSINSIVISFKSLDKYFFPLFPVQIALNYYFMEMFMFLSSLHSFHFVCLLYCYILHWPNYGISWISFLWNFRIPTSSHLPGVIRLGNFLCM